MNAVVVEKYRQAVGAAKAILCDVLGPSHTLSSDSVVALAQSMLDAEFALDPEAS